MSKKRKVNVEVENLNKKEMNETEKNAFKKETKQYEEEIIASLQKIKESNIPFIVFIEGFQLAGPGIILNELIQKLDPRFFEVFSKTDTLNEEKHNFIYPYFNAIPMNGRFSFYEDGYMEATIQDYFHGKLDDAGYRKRINSINNFERTLINNGYRILKIFVGASRKDLKKTYDIVQEYEEYGIIRDLAYEQMNHYKSWKRAYDTVIQDTSEYSKWHILDGCDKWYKVKNKAFRLLRDTIQKALEEGKHNGSLYEESFEMATTPKLADVDLSRTISEEDYKVRLKELNYTLAALQALTTKYEVPVVIGFEGWDAAGKGGTIRRLVYPLNPRDYDVCPIASPDNYEKSRHFLWRFYRQLPKRGFVQVFDRTWYGRVMVERLEGYCSENDWKRAYNEINEFEQDLVDSGAVVLKFWLQIDKDTQLERFTDRQNTPEKQWKITEEDWRNREKWDAYEVAVDEMIQKTSTKAAPWHILPSVDKKYARIKAMEITAEALRDALLRLDLDSKNTKTS